MMDGISSSDDEEQDDFDGNGSEGDSESTGAAHQSVSCLMLSANVSIMKSSVASMCTTITWLTSASKPL